MVMTLCLLVYSALEYKVGQKLRENGEHFLDQLGKPSQNPTTRWVFFCFLGLHIVILNGARIPFNEEVHFLFGRASPQVNGMEKTKGEITHTNSKK